MTDIKVSVIMPAYNCEKYIKQAIESVLEQSVALELIIINDCSKDNVKSVIENYLSDKRVIYVENDQNMGVADTRNKGIHMAKGEYIAFLDSDDWWTKDKLEKQLEVMEQNDAVLCATARELMSPEGHSTGRIIHVPNVIAYKKLLYGNVINCSSVLIKREIMLNYNMKYDDAHEDYITWLDILKNYGNAIGIDEPLLKYRLSEAGKSRNKFKSAKMQYRSLRYAGFGVIRSIFYFIAYGINGVRKHFL